MLRCLHQHLARLAVDLEVGEHELLAGVEVPGVAGHQLVVPLHLAGVGEDREDRGEVEVVAAAGATDVAVPGNAVAGAEVDEIQLGVVGDGIPRGSARALLEPLAGVFPGLRRLLHRLGFERLVGIAGNRVRAPVELTAVGIVGGHVTSHAELRAAVADQHTSRRHPRRSRDRVRLVLLGRALFPDDVPGGRVERGEPPVERRRIDLPFVDGHAAIDHVAAGFLSPLLRHLGIPGPDLRPGARVDRVHHAPGRRGVHHAVDHQRSRLEAAGGIRRKLPRQLQLGDVLVVDLVERAEALLVGTAVVGDPLADLGMLQALVVDLARRFSDTIGADRGGSVCGPQGRRSERRRRDRRKKREQNRCFHGEDLLGPLVKGRRVSRGARGESISKTAIEGLPGLVPPILDAGDGSFYDPKSRGGRS